MVNDQNREAEVGPQRAAGWDGWDPTGGEGGKRDVRTRLFCPPHPAIPALHRQSFGNVTTISS